MLYKHEEGRIPFGKTWLFFSLQHYLRGVMLSACKCRGNGEQRVDLAAAPKSRSCCGMSHHSLSNEPTDSETKCETATSNVSAQLPPSTPRDRKPAPWPLSCTWRYIQPVILLLIILPCNHRGRCSHVWSLCPTVSPQSDAGENKS